MKCPRCQFENPEGAKYCNECGHNLTPLSAEDLLIRNARLIDGTGAPPREGISILIRNSRIAEIGNNISVEKIPQLDVEGAFVLPGLIDSHVHLKWGPGAWQKKAAIPTAEDWEKTWGIFFSEYLRAYVACGVTTVLDTYTPSFVINKIREHLSKGNPGPRFLSLGQFISPPKGYPYPLFKKIPSVSTPEEVDAQLDSLQSQGVIGIKVPIEKGWRPFRDLPLHSPEILEAIKRGAKQRNLPIYVHATSEENFSKALDMEAYALLHTLVYRKGKQLSKAFIERMALTNTYQVSTLSTMDADLALFNLDRLGEPLLEIIVPKVELSTATHPNAGKNARKMNVMTVAPWLPKLFWGIVTNIFFGKKFQVTSLRNSQKAIYDLHKAGVPIVMGSDAVFSPFTIYAFHGFTTLREIELLGESGLSPKEAIKAATVTPSRMIGLDNEIGIIEVGKLADLVILKDNPLNDLRTFRTIQWTVKNGAAKTPNEWMTH